MADTLVIRPCRGDDRDAVVGLWRRHLADPAPHNEPLAAFDDKMRHGDGLLLVALAGERVVGTAMGGWDGHRGWVYSVAVATDMRRRQVGSRLVRALLDELRARGCRKANLQIRAGNEAVVRFYEGLGFAVEDRIDMGIRLYRAT